MWDNAFKIKAELPGVRISFYVIANDGLCGMSRQMKAEQPASSVISEVRMITARLNICRTSITESLAGE
jgi:hypothetical protein